MVLSKVNSHAIIIAYLLATVAGKKTLLCTGNGSMATAGFQQSLSLIFSSLTSDQVFVGQSHNHFPLLHDSNVPIMHVNIPDFKIRVPICASGHRYVCMHVWNLYIHFLSYANTVICPKPM